MFKPSTEKLLVELEESDKVRDDHLHGVNKIIREYVGRWYRGASDWVQNVTGTDLADTNPEPYSYSFVSNILPSLIYENPSVIVTARRVIGHRIVAQAMQAGLRSWILDVNYKVELEKVILDALFFQGILLHYIQDDTRWAAGAVRPAVKWLDCRTWGADSMANSEEDAEFQYHKFYVDTEDLLQDPALKPGMAEQLKDAYHEEQKDLPFRRGDYSALGRKRVCLYSVWVRHSNSIRVVAKQNKGLEIYEEREWYGPETGPYTRFVAYPVPGQIYPLSPLVAVQDQVMDLQVHGRATARSAAARKTVIIVDGTIPNLPDDIHDAEDREVISVPGFNASQCEQLEFGGVTPQQYEYLNFLRERLDKHSGLTEAARGQVGGSNSATEATIANEGLNNRTEYLKGRIRGACAQSLKTIGWFLFHTTGIIIPVNMKDPLTGMEDEGLFFGGPIPSQETGTWLDYSLKIEPLSMQRVSEQVVQRRTIDFANFIMQVAPMMPQIPWIRWMELIRMVGESMNQDNVDTFLVPEILGMMSMPELTPASQEMGGPAGAAPRYFSTPGEGFKQRQAEENSNAPIAVDEMRRGFGEQFGPMGGGRQGPPGSKAQGGALVPSRRY